MPRSVANSYRKTHLSTASPGQRVYLMYDGLAKELKKAIHAIVNIDKDPKNVEIAHNAINLSEQIILELNLALDMEKGGDLSLSLRGLYEFWIDALSEANNKKEVKDIKAIHGMVSELRDTWKIAAQKAKQEGIA